MGHCSKNMPEDKTCVRSRSLVPLSLAEVSKAETGGDMTCYGFDKLSRRYASLFADSKYMKGNKHNA